MNGWLNREGEFIPCESYQHDKVAREHGGSEIIWEESGYVKIFSVVDMIYHKGFLTDAQRDWLVNHEID